MIHFIICNKVDLQSARLWLPGSELAGLGPALLLSRVHHQARRVKCLSDESFIWLISAPGTKILLPYQVSGRFLAPILQRKWAQRLCLRVASPARGKCYNNPPSELPLLNHNRFIFNIFFRTPKDLLQPRETFTLTSFQRKTPDEPKFLSSAKFMGCEANKKVSKCSSNLKGECEDKTFKSQIFNEDNNTQVINKFKTFSTNKRDDGL